MWRVELGAEGGVRCRGVELGAGGGVRCRPG